MHTRPAISSEVASAGHQVLTLSPRAAPAGAAPAGARAMQSAVSADAQRRMVCARVNAPATGGAQRGHGHSGKTAPLRRVMSRQEQRWPPPCRCVQGCGLSFPPLLALMPAPLSNARGTRNVAMFRVRQVHGWLPAAGHEPCFDNNCLPPRQQTWLGAASYLSTEAGARRCSKCAVMRVSRDRDQHSGIATRNCLACR